MNFTWIFSSLPPLVFLAYVALFLRFYNGRFNASKKLSSATIWTLALFTVVAGILSVIGWFIDPLLVIFLFSNILLPFQNILMGMDDGGGSDLLVLVILPVLILLLYWGPFFLAYGYGRFRLQATKKYIFLAVLFSVYILEIFIDWITFVNNPPSIF